MDLEFISSHIPMYVEAAGLTVRIAIYGIIGALIVGLICSLIKELKLPVLKEIVQIYIELSRNTPLLIQLFFLYFGLPEVRHCIKFKSLCDRRPDLFRWQLYGRRIPYRN